MKFRVSGAPVAATLLRLLQLDSKRGRVAFFAVASAPLLSHFHPAEIPSGFRSRGLITPSFPCDHLWLGSRELGPRLAGLDELRSKMTATPKMTELKSIEEIPVPKKIASCNLCQIKVATEYR